MNDAFPSCFASSFRLETLTLRSAERKEDREENARASKMCFKYTPWFRRRIKMLFFARVARGLDAAGGFATAALQRRLVLCVASQTSRDMSENIFGIIRRAVSSRSECAECRLKFVASILNSRHKVCLGARVDKFISLIVTRTRERASANILRACACIAPCKTFKRPRRSTISYVVSKYRLNRDRHGGDIASCYQTGKQAKRR